jgi:extradiol dioxygenase family protein
MLKAGKACLELFEFRKPNAIQGGRRFTYECGIMHFTLDVTNLDELYPRLVAAGVQFHAPPQHTKEAITTYGRDPFGNIIEFQELPPGSHVPRMPLG